MQPEFSKSTGPTSDAGETCETSRPSLLGSGGSIASSEGSHARTSPLLESEQESGEVNHPCSSRSFASFAFFDPDTSSWKTFQTCLLEEWEPFSESWPLSGWMRGGTAFRLPPLVSRRDVGGRSLLPTLQVSDSRQAANGSRKGRDPSWGVTMTDWMRLNANSQRVPVWLAERMMGFPNGWTELESAVTPSALPSPSSSYVAS